MGTCLDFEYDKKLHRTDKICVSVIVPVYNVEKYLERCLNSLRNQSLIEIEIICINDGSTDSSPIVLEKYAEIDARIKIIHQDNKGVADARNLGISVAQGEYIAFIDSDDYVDVDYLEKLYNTAVKYSADIAAASIYRIMKNRNRYLFKFNSIKKSNKAKNKFKYFRLPSFNQPCNKIYRTKLFKTTGLNFLSGKYYEDIFFTYQILYYSGAAVTVPKTKYYYCINSDSITCTPNSQKEKDWEEASLMMQNFVQERNIMSGVGKHWISKLVYEFKFFNLTVWSVLKYGKYNQYRLLGIPIFCKREENYGGE